MVSGRAVGSIRAQVGESPVWSQAEQALFWVDAWGRAVIRTDPAIGTDRVFGTPELAGAVAALPHGGVVLAGETGLFLGGQGNRGWQALSSPSDLPADHRFNDMTVDPAGHLIVGTIKASGERGPTGVLYRHSHGQWRVLMSGLATVNGLAFSPDGMTLYVSDSHPSVATVWALHYDPASGAVGERRVLRRFGDLRGRPDGAAVDADGVYWIAAVGGGRLFGLGRDGAVVGEKTLPVERPTKLAFGGANGQRLFVTSMSAMLESEDAGGLAGALIEVEPDKPGLIPPAFEG
jgi:sugar lactone lactonase YvrE